jgi:hypothetical protein
MPHRRRSKTGKTATQQDTDAAKYRRSKIPTQQNTE